MTLTTEPTWATTSSGAVLPLIALPHGELLTVNEMNIRPITDSLTEGVHAKPFRLAMEAGRWVVLATCSPGATVPSAYTQRCSIRLYTALRHRKGPSMMTPSPMAPGSMARFETRQIDVDGVQSPVLIGGAGIAGEAVVFVHGNPDAGADWLPLMERIADFATAVAPDMPGFGGADMRPDQDYTLAGYAAHLGGLIDRLGLDRVHLVAHDFGGPFALTWAAAHPDRVASVTLINTGVLIGYRWHRMAKLWRTPLLGDLVMRVSNRRVANFVIRHDNPGLPESWVSRIAGHLVPRGTKRAVLRLYRSTRQRHMDAVIDPLRAADLDALVVFGDADVYIPAVQAERQRRPFPRVRIEMLPGVGHWAWLEQPDRVAEIVVPFLRQRVGQTV